MNNQPAFGGIQIIDSTADLMAAKLDINLGPLAQLQGKWQGQSGQGWNVIAVPGPGRDGFVLEVIPYEETLTFSPVVIAGNRGPFANTDLETPEQVQSITGLLYEQVITSVCTEQSCIDRGFGSGTEIHAETGLFLYLSNFDSGFNIARLSTIPHGNSVLAPGNGNLEPVSNPGNSFIPDISSIPHPNPTPGIDGYFDRYGQPFEFPQFDPGNPNLFIQNVIEVEKISALTTLNFSTKNASGGILNIPFIQSNINATDMESTFWIEELADGSVQLQYSQNIDLVFPPTGSTVSVTWPHVTVNTLQKVS